MFSIAQNAGEPDAVGRFKLLVPRYGITAVTVPTNMFIGRNLSKFLLAQRRPPLGPSPG